MSRRRYTVDDVIRAMDEIVDGRPDRVDPRPGRGLGGRYAEHGKPCCLVGEILVKLGASVATLKDLDRDSEQIKGSRHNYWRRFEPVTLELLTYLQDQNDSATSWDRIRIKAFQANRYWLRESSWRYRSRAFPGPWCTEENVRSYRGY